MSIIIGMAFLAIWLMKNIPAIWIPFIAAGLGFLLSRIYESWKESKARLYEKKREVYSNLLKPYQNVLINSMVNRNANENESTELNSKMIEFAANSAFEAIMFASDDVVKAYGDFRNTSISEKPTSETIMRNFSRLLRAMRKDLGHSWTSLSDIEILAMFINLTPEERLKYRKL